MDPAENQMIIFTPDLSVARKLLSDLGMPNVTEVKGTVHTIFTFESADDVDAFQDLFLDLFD